MGEKKEGEKKNNEGQNKGDGGVSTLVFKFDMHCEGCAKKVRRSIKKLDGVENVKTEFSAGKLTVVGKVDAVKIQEKVEEKMKKKVELLSLQTNKPSNNKDNNGGEKKSDEKKSGEKKSDEKKSGDKKGDEKKSEVKSDEKKSEDKKDQKPKEPQISTVLLKTRVHCDGCAQKIKKIVRKCDGVQDVNVDLQKDVIALKGTMNVKDLLPYLNVKLKRTVELAPAKKDEGAGGDKKPKEDGGAKEKPKEGGGGGGSKEKPKEGGSGSSEKPKGGGGGDKKEGGGGEGSASKENVTKIEINKMEYNPYAHGYGAHAYTFDPRQQEQSYGHQVVDYWHEPEYSHPQMFSDENPNACSVM
ncbi:hypothetical protein BVRB_7g161540 [Beta vulgaris subsp. vulgaris]|nr:hypothetical protein BVRB_7g161540 [Beta vulgaris subsp. vulgaris]